jgi:hypothetical protein
VAAIFVQPRDRIRVSSAVRGHLLVARFESRNPIASDKRSSGQCTGPEKTSSTANWTPSLHRFAPSL